MPVLAGLTLTALIVTAAVTDRRSVIGAVGLGMLGLIWLFVNQPMEGLILVSFDSKHGFTAADVAGLAAIAAAAGRGWVIRRSRSSTATTHARGRRDVV